MAGTSTIFTEIYRDFPYSGSVDKAPAVATTLEAVGFRSPRRKNSVGPKSCWLFLSGFYSSGSFLGPSYEALD
jgi:hypothetical protein